ncbi:MAG: transcriptional regulator [SAR86 cluster bacterium]|jgi:TrpR-related protein YerC/YecD|nr:transcriptional regulator [SAR86 cluster bacterium]MDA9935739.1 YerC/YecD family TrpR-related protein [Gammaproteobacteria bacterium]MDB3881154.1 YerC/YecD family TrpR-related protein [Gammaproteobacteria bacterium]
MKLSKVLKELNSSKDIEKFLLDLCTPSEIEAMEERWEVAQLLYEGKSTYRDIASKLNTSTATVTRVARFLFKETNQGYIKVLKKGLVSCNQK